MQACGEVHDESCMCWASLRSNCVPQLHPMFQLDMVTASVISGLPLLLLKIQVSSSNELRSRLDLPMRNRITSAHQEHWNSRTHACPPTGPWLCSVAVFTRQKMIVLYNTCFCMLHS